MQYLQAIVTLTTISSINAASIRSLAERHDGTPNPSVTRRLGDDGVYRLHINAKRFVANSDWKDEPNSAPVLSHSNSFGTLKLPPVRGIAPSPGSIRCRTMLTNEGFGVKPLQISPVNHHNNNAQQNLFKSENLPHAITDTTSVDKENSYSTQDEVNDNSKKKQYNLFKTKDLLLDSYAKERQSGVITEISPRAKGLPRNDDDSDNPIIPHENEDPYDERLVKTRTASTDRRTASMDAQDGSSSEEDSQSPVKQHLIKREKFRLRDELTKAFLYSSSSRTCKAGRLSMLPGKLSSDDSCHTKERLNLLERLKNIYLKYPDVALDVFVEQCKINSPNIYTFLQIKKLRTEIWFGQFLQGIVDRDIYAYAFVDLLVTNVVYLSDESKISNGVGSYKLLMELEYTTPGYQKARPLYECFPKLNAQFVTHGTIAKYLSDFVKEKLSENDKIYSGKASEARSKSVALATQLEKFNHNRYPRRKLCIPKRIIKNLRHFNFVIGCMISGRPACATDLIRNRLPRNLFENHRNSCFVCNLICCVVWVCLPPEAQNNIYWWADRAV